MKNAGEDIEKVLEQSIVNNWTDVYPVKLQPINCGYESKRDKDRRETIEELTGRRHEIQKIININ